MKDPIDPKAASFLRSKSLVMYLGPYLLLFRLTSPEFNKMLGREADPLSPLPSFMQVNRFEAAFLLTMPYRLSIAECQWAC